MMKVPLFVMAIFLACLSCKNDQQIKKPPTEYNKRFDSFRGFNVHPNIGPETIRDIKATGANHVRISFPDLPLINRTAPYEINQDAMQKMDSIINWCEEYGLQAVIDVHTAPGTKDVYTIYPDDAFWRTQLFQDQLNELWRQIATKYKDRGNVIAGYDLLNEPAVPEDLPNAWNDLVKRLWKTIRETGDMHTIIVESFGKIVNGEYIDRHVAISDLVLPQDDNIVVSVHTYEPLAFTHQGIYHSKSGVRYPSAEYGKKEMEKSLQHIVDFQKKHPGVPVYIGEFSASRAGGADSDAYVNDLLYFFEKYNWNWAYHDFRGSNFWDAEMAVGTSEKLPRSSETPRMNMLKEHFQLNKAD